MGGASINIEIHFQEYIANSRTIGQRPEAPDQKCS